MDCKCPICNGEMRVLRLADDDEGRPVYRSSCVTEEHEVLIHVSGAVIEQMIQGWVVEYLNRIDAKSL